MSAPKGNKYAERWTYENTYERLLVIEKYSYEDDFLYLGQALSYTGLYDDVWRYWRRKWHARYEIIDIMKRIMQRFEVRLFTKMAKSEIPARVATFALRHHYGWGRDPDTATEITDDLSYVDQQIIYEPHPLRSEQSQADTTAPQEQEPIQEPTPEPLQDSPEIEQPKTGFADPATFMQKRKAYNAANPYHHVSHLCLYYYGTPPHGKSTIPFDGGYFTTIDLQALEAAAAKELEEENDD